MVIILAESSMKLIESWANEGSLPAFKSLMTEGTSGPLQAQVPLITPQMIGKIITGKSAGHHGLFDFWQRGADGKFVEINGSNVKEKPVWQVLSENNLRCGVVNVPLTYPPQELNGFIISGQDAPGTHRSIALPAGLYDEIVGKLGRYRFKDIFPGGKKKSEYLTLFEEYINWQTELLEYLITEKEWDFFITFYSASAMAGHYFWADMISEDENNPYKNIIKNAYRSLDKAIGRIMKASGDETTLFVISECGMGNLESGVQINTWLEKEGFFTRKSKGPESAGKKVSVRNEKSALHSVVESLRRNARSWISTDGLYWVNKNLNWLRERVQSYLVYSDFDWTKIKAFSRGKEGEIYINLKGRDPHGIVNPGEEYESVRKDIIERLSQLSDPKTGVKIVDRVYRFEELYEGPMIEWAPDLIIAWKDTSYVPTESSRDKESIFVTRWREYMNWPTTGSHRVNGILYAKGPGICRGKRIEGAKTIDMMPTWLHYLNQKIPAGLEGKVLSDLFEQKI